MERIDRDQKPCKGKRLDTGQSRREFISLHGVRNAARR